MTWLRSLDWTGVWHAIAVALFLLALVILADYAGDIIVASR